MNTKKIIILSIYFFLILGKGIYAQQGPVVTGADLTGGGGTAAYSVGQIDYVTIEGSGGNANLGLQQPREFFTTSVLEIGTVGFNAYVFPNPSSGDITLTVQNGLNSKMHYSLFNMQGQQIAEGPIIGNSTNINLNETASGAYFLRINTDNKSIKIFKIIKQ